MHRETTVTFRGPVVTRPSPPVTLASTGPTRKADLDLEKWPLRLRGQQMRGV